MLHEFIAANRDAIIARTKAVGSRPWPPIPMNELERGVPVFLTQVAETLRLEATDTPFPARAIGVAAARHAAYLLRSGFDVSQVVHGYGDIFDAITDLAVELEVPITVRSSIRCTTVSTPQSRKRYWNTHASRPGRDRPMKSSVSGTQLTTFETSSTRRSSRFTP
jgi:hypothetical protein